MNFFLFQDQRVHFSYLCYLLTGKNCRMKKLKIFAAAVLLASGAAGCGPKTILPEFGLFSVDTTLRAGAMDCSIQYEFATITNAKASPALEAIEASNIGYFFSLESFTGTAHEAAALAIAQFVRENRTEDLVFGKDRVEYETSVTITSEATVVDTILVYTIAYASYTGGAHGIYGQSVHNYSIANGYEFTLSDLFDEEQLYRLKEIVRSKLYDEFGATSDEELAEQGFFPEYIDATDNFALTGDGIVFYYNPYDIGCYALGAIEVPVGREELEAL